MASAMAIKSEVIGECVEGIRIEVERTVAGMGLVCLEFFWLGAQCLVGSVVGLR